MELRNVHEVYHENIRCMLLKQDKMCYSELEIVNYTVHRIEPIQGARHVRQMSYCQGPSGREFGSKKVDTMLKAGVITPFSSEWVSPVVSAPKKDGKLRFCVEYRKLHALTHKDVFPVPRVDDEYILWAKQGYSQRRTCNEGSGTYQLQRDTSRRQHSRPKRGCTSSVVCRSG